MFYLLVATALVSAEPASLPGLDALPDLATMMPAKPIVDGDWLAFDDSGTVVRLAPVPSLPAKPTCATLPKSEPNWAGYWRFPTAPPVVLHVAEEATLWQYAAARHCWVAVPLAVRGPVTKKIEAKAGAEPKVSLALAALDPMLADWVFVEEQGEITLMEGDEAAAFWPVPAAASVGAAKDQETWLREREVDEARPHVSRVLSASLEVDGESKVLEVRREASWRTDPSRQGGAIVGKRVTFARIDVSALASGARRTLTMRDGAYSNQSGDGSALAYYTVQRTSRERVPGGSLSSVLAHFEHDSSSSLIEKRSRRSSHDFSLTLSSGGRKIELFPVVLDAPEPEQRASLEVDVGGSAMALALGTRLEVGAAGTKRSVMVTRLWSDAAPLKTKSALAARYETGHVVVAARVDRELRPGSAGGADAKEAASCVLVLARDGAGVPLRVHETYELVP